MPNYFDSSSKTLTTAGLILALALGGCATTKSATQNTKPKADEAAVAAKPDPAQVQSLIKDDPIAAAAYWGSIHDSNPKDANAAAQYGDALRQMGSMDKAVTVLQESAGLLPHDSRVLASYGKALGAAGRPDDASGVLERAIALDPKNAETLSAAGVVQDQLGHPNEAKVHYEAALKIKPSDAVILSNYGLSRAFAGDLPKAEELLARAAASDDATPQIRQNYALVLSLAGKFDQARRVAGHDLMPKEAENNIDYVRDMLGKSAPLPANSGPDQAQLPTGAPRAP